MMGVWIDFNGINLFCIAVNSYWNGKIANACKHIHHNFAIFNKLGYAQTFIVIAFSPHDFGEIQIEQTSVFLVDSLCFISINNFKRWLSHFSANMIDLYY